MKRFRFRLDPVLRIRRFEHDQEAGRLATRRQKRDLILAAAERADANASALAATLAAAATKGVPALYWQANAGALVDHMRELQERRAALRSADAELAAARERLLAARARVRTLETLRERSFERHRRESERQEQRILDEIGNQRAAGRRIAR